MYSSLQLAKKYIAYYWNASNGKGHGMHSPFVFDFILHVLNNKKGYRPPASIEALRKRLLKDGTLIEINDLGAGSRRSKGLTRSIAQLAKAALKPPKYAQVLYRLVRHYQPSGILELGTSLGITTAYLAAANHETAVTTVEGAAATAAVAAFNFETLRLANIELRTGHFDTELPLILGRMPVLGLAYIDGNHRYEPTIRYFHQLLQKADAQTILVFDDIHWSGDMEKAWAEIKAHPSVRCTIDIFFLGFVFFRKEFAIPRHFTIRH